MIQVILADNQAIFRAGAARVLALEDNVSIVAHCEDTAHLENALDAHAGAILLVSASLQADAGGLIARAREAGSRVILVAENGTEVADALARSLDGIVFRGVSGWRRVSARCSTRTSPPSWRRTQSALASGTA
jgi:DNA-binding NarL/FixJ family response regulator